MKAVLLNGSPRKGNTVSALEALKKGMASIADLEIRQIDAEEVSVCPCIACDHCKENDGTCVFDDDTNEVIGAVAEADILVFATPVYWWGVTAQLKAIIDKFYSRSEQFAEMSKKVGLIVIGEAEQGDPQYEIISKQFECICNYLGWELTFSKTYTAADPGDLAKSDAAMKELQQLGEAF
ncbi:MAG: flavodoxin family protein [Bacillota bacterium]|nr:flavodoxin family protein [Bacillota bacterium]